MDPILIATIGIVGMFVLIMLHFPIGIAMAIAGFVGILAILGPEPAFKSFCWSCISCLAPSSRLSPP